MSISVTPLDGHKLQFETQGDSYVSISQYKAVYDDPQLSVKVTLILESSPGRLPRRSSVTFEARGPEATVKATDIRAVPLESLTTRAAQAALFQRMPEDDPWYGMPPSVTEWTEDDVQRFVQRRAGQDEDGPSIDPLPPHLERRRTRTRVTPERLRRVADTYRRAVLAGESTAEAVAKVEYASEDYARKLIQKARKSGDLGPAIRGKAGEVQQPAEGGYEAGESAGARSEAGQEA